MSSSIIGEIKQFKDQLDGLLNRKYSDPAIILGINTVIQSKFETWILDDSKEYYDTAEVDVPNSQVEFNTIKFFDTLWSNFHYPIIKFFQYHHAQIFNQVLEKYQSSNQLALKPVEIRKLNDFFIKFIKSIYTFYFNLLKHFSTFYENQLIPKHFLDHFEFTVPASALLTKNSNVQANLLFLIHKCLLSLGDLSRHRTFIEISYVIPNLSVKQFHKFRSSYNEKKFQLMRPYYNSALTFYRFCISLLPALNEPYNHIGMIYNLLDDKINACYWFLRSRFTRIVSYKLAITNLNNLLKKSWFKTQLVEILIKSNINDFNKKPLAMKNYNLNVLLVILINYYYLPNIYRYNKSKKIVKNLKYDKIEFIFLNLNFNNDNFVNLLDKAGNDEEINMNFYVKQLVLLMSFGNLIKLNNEGNESRRFNDFFFRYLEGFYGNVMKLSSIVTSNSSHEIFKNLLIFTRVLLNYFREENLPLNAHRFNFVGLLTSVFNKILNDLDNHGSGHEDSSISQESKYVEIIDDLKSSNSRPIRNYYFAEDVTFKDFQIIKYQFKDFKDDHLFQANDINLLNNDFRGLIFNKFPSFLDNKVFLNLENNQNPELVDAEVSKYEDFLRLKAILITGKRLLKGKAVVDGNRFILTEGFKAELEKLKAKKKAGIKKKSQKKKTQSSSSSHDTTRIGQSQPKNTWANVVAQDHEMSDEPRSIPDRGNGSSNRVTNETNQGTGNGGAEEAGNGDNGDADTDDDYDSNSDSESDTDSEGSIDEIESFIRSHINQLQTQIEVNTDPSQSITQTTPVNIWNKSFETSKLPKPDIQEEQTALALHQVSASGSYSKSNSQFVVTSATVINSSSTNGSSSVLGAQQQAQPPVQVPQTPIENMVPQQNQYPIPPNGQQYPNTQYQSQYQNTQYPNQYMAPGFLAGNTPFNYPTQTGYYPNTWTGQYQSMPPPLAQSTQASQVSQQPSVPQHFAQYYQPSYPMGPPAQSPYYWPPNTPNAPGGSYPNSQTPTRNPNAQ